MLESHSLVFISKGNVYVCEYIVSETCIIIDNDSLSICSIYRLSGIVYYYVCTYVYMQDNSVNAPYDL